jgi:hypothetical protein
MSSGLGKYFRVFSIQMKQVVASLVRINAHFIMSKTKEAWLQYNCATVKRINLEWTSMLLVFDHWLRVDWISR